MGIENSVFLGLHALISNQGINPFSTVGSIVTISTAALGIYNYIRTQNIWKSIERAGALLFFFSLLGAIFYFINNPPDKPPPLPVPHDLPPPLPVPAQVGPPTPVNLLRSRITTSSPLVVESDDYSEHYSIAVANYIRNELPSYGITVTTNAADAAAVLEVKHVSYDLEGNYSDEALEQNPADDQLPPQSSITIQLFFRPRNGSDKPFYQSFNCRRTAPPNSTQEAADDLAMQADLLNIYQYLIGKTNTTTCPP